MTLGITRPRYPALERAGLIWGVEPESIDPPPSNLVRMLRVQTFCNTPVQPKPQPRILTDPTYWRCRAFEEGIDLGEPA